MLKPDGEGEDFIEKVGQRLHALTYHMRNYFRLDFPHLNNISRYKTEEYSHTAVNMSSLFNFLFLFLLIRLAWKMMIHFIMSSFFFLYILLSKAWLLLIRPKLSSPLHKKTNNLMLTWISLLSVEEECVWTRLKMLREVSRRSSNTSAHRGSKHA